jgi:hypothetical protein
MGTQEDDDKGQLHKSESTKTIETVDRQQEHGWKVE